MMYANYDTENGRRIPTETTNLSLFKNILVSPHYMFPMTNT